jgi:hypothetical protein
VKNSSPVRATANFDSPFELEANSVEDYEVHGGAIGREYVTRGRPRSKRPNCHETDEMEDPNDEIPRDKRMRMESELPADDACAELGRDPMRDDRLLVCIL